MIATGIDVYDDLIDESLIVEALNVIRRYGFRYGWKSNNQVSFSHWNLPLSRTGTNSANRKDIRGELPPPVLKLWESFQPSRLPNTPVLIRTCSNGYTYGNDGYIHQDSQAPEDMSAIIYLNKEWNANWAGETALFDSTGEIIRSVLPKWRRLLIFPANVYHVGRGVSRICPHLRNVLVFKVRPVEPEPIDQSRVALE
ncbi:MAG: 2OG-Fe(II) oxygenase family protein [Bacteroidota bacterium]|nr:2OG-Fe(II) oxygenase family protein [Bacteroidota bacterium]MDP4234318.1 2OG-Fe(II) oxygenase family protein [Bacteroidota bacterium]MDP4243252.1 2OG-Fe(II) oxygenase family protein [Bacteroidota bacterium]MDP4288041.1 2OG-Fe(II) oxygenase family protein [Bacteroidota bacterium]